MSVNSVTLIGKLGQDVLLKYTKSGTAVATFSLATNKTWTDKAGAKQEKTSWHNILIWDKRAELCSKYLSKGSTIYLEGELDYRTWKKEDGTDAYKTEIVAHKIEFLDKKGDVKPTTKQAPAKEVEVKVEHAFTAGDIPF